MVKSAGTLVSFSILVAALSFAGCAPRPSDRPLLSVPPATVSDNKIYIAEAGERIRALDQNGKEQWSFSVGDSLARATNRSSRDFQTVFLAAREGGKVFGLAGQLSGAHAGTMYLFALAENHLLWQTEVRQPTSEVPRIALGKMAIYEAGNDGVLYAFAQSDGHLLWQHHVSDGPLGALTIGNDDTIYVIGPLSHLHALAPNGSEKWAIETHN
jgi:outer membrane protein assembly factor BamB